jgi:methionyl-tRNA formyltransferase
MNPLRLVFAGTPEFAVPCLRAAVAVPGVQLVGVCTQPDRPAGRGRQLAASPVKQAALAADGTLPILQPESLKPEEAQAALAALAPDLLLVVAYGLILPRAVLALPRHGCWNVHGSALPRWRGAAPIQRAIAAGDAETGVDLMMMEAGLDTGPVLLSRRTPITADETGGSLHDRLALLGAEVVGEGLRRLLAGTLPAAVAQPADGITYAHKLDKAEARLDWSLAAAALERQIRAFQPWPIATAELAGEVVQVLAARVSADTGEGAIATPGTVLPGGRDALRVQTGAGVLELTRLRPAGKNTMSAAEYLNGRPALKLAATSR